MSILSGNTKAIVYEAEYSKHFDIYNIAKDELNFDKYDTIIIGTLTLGRGMPPPYFRDIQSELFKIRGKKVGLFGSGQSIYGDNYFCGALDVLEDLFLKLGNEILFKLKYESYPTKDVIDQFNNYLGECLHEDY